MKQMNLLFVWSSLFGLHPLYHAKCRDKSAVFEILRKSWCFAVFVFQVIITIRYSVSIYASVNSSFTGTTSLILVLPLLGHAAHTAVTNLVPRFLCLHIRQFKSCLEHLEACKTLSGRKDSLTTWNVGLALFLWTIWVAAEMVLTLPVYFSFEDVTYSQVCALMFWRSVGAAHQVCIYVCIYAVVTLTADEIQTATEDFNQLAAKFQSMPLTDEDRRVFCTTSSTRRLMSETACALSAIKTRVNHINQACDHFIQTFSSFVLFVTATKLVRIVITIYQVVNSVLYVRLYHGRPDYFTMTLRSIQMIVDCGTVLVLFHWADIPVDKMKNLSRTVKDSITATLSPTEKLDVKCLLEAAEHERLRLSAGGLFTIGKELIPGIIGTIITYIVIMLQAGVPGVKLN